MPMEAWRDEEGVQPAVDLPRGGAQQNEVGVGKKILTIRAESAQPEGRQYIAGSQRLWGQFSRELVLGDHLDPASIQARYADGVLRLDIAVAEAAKPRRIEISTAAKGEVPKELAS